MTFPAPPHPTLSSLPCSTLPYSALPTLPIPTLLTLSSTLYPTLPTLPYSALPTLPIPILLTLSSTLYPTLPTLPSPTRILPYLTLLRPYPTLPYPTLPHPTPPYPILSLFSFRLERRRPPSFHLQRNVWNSGSARNAPATGNATQRRSGNVLES